MRTALALTVMACTLVACRPDAVDEPTPPSTDPAPSYPTTQTTGGGVVVYLHLGSGSGALLPVWRPAPDASLDAALGMLLKGPSPGEEAAVPALRTAIPSGSKLLAVTVDDGLATLNLSAEFSSAGADGVAQVVYTATRHGEVNRVRMLVDGRPLGASESAVAREDFLGSLPPIFVDDPPYGGPMGGRVSGRATVDVLQLALENAAGRTIAELAVSVAGSTAGGAAFDVPLTYLVDEEQIGTLTSFRYDPAFSPEDVRRYPVTLRPPTSVEQACSAGSVLTEPVARPELPNAVDAARRAIIAAASSCDFAALGGLAGRAEFFSFDSANDPGAFWLQQESLGDPLTRRMVQLLNGPYLVEATTYAWPRAYRFDPDEDDWVSLEGIYDAADIDQFRRAGDYLGLRLGIDENGIWQFAVTGD